MQVCQTKTCKDKIPIIPNNKRQLQKNEHVHYGTIQFFTFSIYPDYSWLFKRNSNWEKHPLYVLFQSLKSKKIYIWIHRKMSESLDKYFAHMNFILIQIHLNLIWNSPQTSSYLKIIWIFESNLNHAKYHFFLKFQWNTSDKFHIRFTIISISR